MKVFNMIIVLLWWKSKGGAGDRIRNNDKIREKIIFLIVVLTSI